MPADFGAACVQGLDARQHLRGQARIKGLNWRHIDAHAAHAQGMQTRQLRIGHILVHVHNASAMRRAHGLHGLQHAGVVAAIGRGLDKHKTHQTQMAGQMLVFAPGRVRWCVAQAICIRVGAGWAEHVEVGIASVGGGGKGRRAFFFHGHGFSNG